MARKRLPLRPHLLSVREVQTAKEGHHSDGGGLLLQVRGDSATWVLRFNREMGLGSVERSNATIAGKGLTGARCSMSYARLASRASLPDWNLASARTQRG